MFVLLPKNTLASKIEQFLICSWKTECFTSDMSIRRHATSNKVLPSNHATSANSWYLNRLWTWHLLRIKIIYHFFVITVIVTAVLPWEWWSSSCLWRSHGLISERIRGLADLVGKHHPGSQHQKTADDGSDAGWTVYYGIWPKRMKCYEFDGGTCNQAKYVKCRDQNLFDAIFNSCSLIIVECTHHLIFNSNLNISFQYLLSSWTKERWSQ